MVSSALTQIHLDTYGQWQAFYPQHFGMLEMRHALLAEGPQQLTQRYAAKVNEYGIYTSILPNYTPALSTLQVLTLGDNCFIGKFFQFTVQRESA